MFADVMVWSYSDCKYLSTPKEGGSLTQCYDISEVADDNHDQNNTTVQAAGRHFEGNDDLCVYNHGYIPGKSCNIIICL